MIMGEDDLEKFVNDFIDDKVNLDSILIEVE